MLFVSIVIMLGGIFCVTFWNRDGDFTLPDFINSFQSLSGAIVGDMLMLLASALFGLYEVSCAHSENHDVMVNAKMQLRHAMVIY